jgi:pimeloyl-ACP methyl ester carboxylesterase
MGRTIPGAELHVLDGSGHCPMWERRQAFNELLREFARRALSPSG